MSAPEARARELIDRQLQAAGWILQHRDELNRTAGRGVAVRGRRRKERSNGQLELDAR